MHIIVPTCAAYSDAWGPFVTFFRRFWPKCPYPMILITDRDAKLWTGGPFIEHGIDLGWCRNFLIGITGIKPEPEFVLMLQEDFWLTAPPDQEFIKGALAVLQAEPDVACFRLYPCPGSDRNIGSSKYGEISLGADYRVSCQAGIWRTSELKRLLARYDSPAQFELFGTPWYQTQPEIRFLSVNRDYAHWPIQYICTAIVRGQWLPGALDYAKAQNVPVDTSRRSVMGGPR